MPGPADGEGCTTRSNRFLEGRRFHLAVAALLVAHAAMLARIAVVNAPMGDEPGHLAAGVYHWRDANFDLFRVNPPLIRMLAAIPLVGANITTRAIGHSDNNANRPEFRVSQQFVADNADKILSLFVWARWALIPISVFGGWICLRWATELFGKPSGLVALTLWCVCPNVLAWGATIMPDLGAAAFGVAAAYTFWKWLERPCWGKTAIACITLACAELSKTTWIVLFALWPFLWLVWQCRAIAFRNRALSASQLLFILVGALVAMNMCYGFESSFERLDSFGFTSQRLAGDVAEDATGNIFRGNLLGRVPVPLPANYLYGMDSQLSEFDRGKWSYLRGEYKFGGWPHFYLYALAVKTPLGTIALLFLSLVLLVSRREYRLPFAVELVLWAPAIVVLVTVSSQTGFNRYLRYVLPAVPFLLIAASRVGKAFQLRQSVLSSFCVFAVAASACGSMWVFPHSLSYFNAAAGGPTAGPHHLLDANVDWGQDLFQLKTFVDAHPEVKPIGLAYFGFVDPSLVGLEFTLAPGWAEEEPRDPDQAGPEPGWFAVSVNHVYGYRHLKRNTPKYAYFQKFTPVAPAGYSIFIYHVTLDEANRVRKELGLSPISGPSVRRSKRNSPKVADPRDLGEM